MSLPGFGAVVISFALLSDMQATLPAHGSYSSVVSRLPLLLTEHKVFVLPPFQNLVLPAYDTVNCQCDWEESRSAIQFCPRHDPGTINSPTIIVLRMCSLLFSTIFNVRAQQGGPQRWWACWGTVLAQCHNSQSIRRPNDESHTNPKSILRIDDSRMDFGFACSSNECAGCHRRRFDKRAPGIPSRRRHYHCYRGPFW